MLRGPNIEKVPHVTKIWPSKNSRQTRVFVFGFNWIGRTFRRYFHPQTPRTLPRHFSIILSPSSTIGTDVRTYFLGENQTDHRLLSTKSFGCTKYTQIFVVHLTLHPATSPIGGDSAFATLCRRTNREHSILTSKPNQKLMRKVVESFHSFLGIHTGAHMKSRGYIQKGSKQQEQQQGQENKVHIIVK